MGDSTALFVSELIRAANEMQRLSYFERGRLMARAAATIRDYREQIAYSESPANDTGPGDIASDLASMGKTPQVFTAAKALGAKGGKKRAENMTPERRAEIAKKAAESRWKR